MHSYLVDMCRGCMKTNINLYEDLIIENVELKCSYAVKQLLPNIKVTSNLT